MGVLLRNFRRWWQPPRNIRDREEERTVTFLELFYDLVYVVLVAELAHAMAADVSLGSIGRFAFLFVIVWWAWFNGSIYHDLHGNNDIRTRIFTFLQMGCVAAMAVFAHNAMGEGSAGFAFSYAAFTLILMFLWWRTGVYDPDHRPLSRPYVVGYFLASLLLIGSVFVAESIRFYLWGIAIFSTMLLPLVTFNMGRNDPDIQAQIALSRKPSPSLVERFGLFTIIVLGEVIVGAVQGLAEHHDLTWEIGLTAVLGMVIAIGIWWIYFDFVSHHLPIEGTGTVFTWLYLHLPMTMGIVGVGAAVLNVVEHAGEHLPDDVRWLLVGAIALALFCIAWLMRVIQIPEELREAYRMGGNITFISSLVILLLGLSGLSTIPLLVLVIGLMLTPVAYGIKVWVNMLDREEIAIS